MYTNNAITNRKERKRKREKEREGETKYKRKKGGKQTNKTKTNKQDNNNIITIWTYSIPTSEVGPHILDWKERRKQFQR